MNIETLLYGYPTLGKEILKLNKELSEFLKSKDEDYGTLGNGGIKFIPQGGSSDEYNPIIETILRFDKHIKKLTDRINEIIDQKEYTEKLLTYLEPNERRIVEIRYFQAQCWYVVSMKAHYSEKACRIINKKAIEKLRWWDEKTTLKDAVAN